jgi:cytochrome c oxidase cbb3-type subunit 3
MCSRFHELPMNARSSTRSTPVRTPTSLTTARVLVAACVASLSVVGCEREDRQLHQSAQASKPPIAISADASPPQLTEVQPGPSVAEPRTTNPDESRAYDVAQGKQWFKWYNCNGCHADGGGDKGPALMDDLWIYGAQPQNIFASIVEGRPNGMPSFGRRIPEAQVWQLVAYVRSMSGHVPSDVAPSRDDRMQTKTPENRTKAQPPKQESTASSPGEPAK